MIKKYFFYLICLLALSACFDSKKGQDNQLNIYNWSDYVDPETVELFANNNNIKVNYSYYDSNESLEAKILTGQSGYDLVFPGSANMQRQIKAGAYEKLDKSKIPNYQLIDPQLLELMQSIDPNNDYAIPYFIGINTIAINVEQVKKRIGQKLPEDIWDLVFNPKYTKELKGCGISLLDSPSEIFPLVLSYLDLDPATDDPEDINKAYEALKKVRPDIKRFNSSGYINDLARGDLCVVVGYGGDLNIAAKTAKAANTPFTIKVLAPKTKTAIWIDSAAIPIGAKHVDNAYLYINHFLEPKIAAQNGNFVTFQPGSKPAKDLMKKEYTENPSIFINEDVIKTGFIIKTFSPILIKKTVKLWQQLKVEK
ncbi:extracellular solute-binding protein [Neisseriaceae bacterium PsAf]|nr:extracellular solute-binding protein [Neisseriaceae bacterium PsAf]